MNIHTFLLQFAFLYAPLIHGTVEQVCPGIWRGPDPKRVAIQKLHDQGFKTIISLRTNPEYPKQAICSKLGMQWIQIPTGVFLVPTPDQLDLFRSVVNNPTMQPVYVSCEVNMDRTGMYLAAYHRCDQKWTEKQVKDEFVKYHQKVWWPVFRRYEGAINTYWVKQQSLTAKPPESSAPGQATAPTEATAPASANAQTESSTPVTAPAAVATPSAASAPTSVQVSTRISAPATTSADKNAIK